VLLFGHALGSHRPVEFFTQDVGVAGVPTGFGEHVDEEVEEGHFGVLPPGHPARRIEREGGHRRVAVVPYARVAADDVAARLVFGHPHVGGSLGQEVLSRQGFGQGTVEDLAEQTPIVATTA
jgi:hypothetical protein